MGLDVVLYGRQREQLGVINISYTLHEAMYIENNQWASYQLLRELRDYYKTDITFDRAGINEFIYCLEQIKLFVRDEQMLEELKLLISFLSNPNVEQIHVAGD
ncbi:hypothetical protein [Paenibacillus sp. N3.4]|uniref:hypothetical protein n=1 Tax=Paenibacillus sp. N3.4 TaxID=2603222 RepID=UPI0011CC701E|nr:hypothetical protein [Paenibacillus sp. N3.4]TXK85129.1 hypothetical protein FU659_05125 [Paenibacillus sp. N3.4]